MKRFAVVGDPIAHSRSPRMHAAAYQALGLPHAYEALHVTAADLPAVVQRVKSGELAGINVTLPHKVRVLDLVDRVAPSAAACGAANTLAFDRGQVVAHNTDLPALVHEIEALGRARGTAIVLGNGGASRAAVHALRLLGFDRIVVRARTAEPLAPGDAERTTSLVVQATSLGLDPAHPDVGLPARAIDWDALPPGAAALDLVYSPRITPFLEAARRAGLPCAHGLGMLARQGALAFELWLGGRAPLYTMWSSIL